MASQTWPKLGFGAASLGSETMSEEQAERLCGLLLELGLTLVDTAPSYGLSEQRIGRYLGRAHRRGEVLVSTKVGYGVEGVADWTFECVRLGIDQALERMDLDHLDVVHLHSCPRDTLIHHGVIEALVQARDAGKLRYAAYSGDNEPLDWVLDDGRLDSVQCSLNLFDRQATASAAQARAQGMRVIAKRPMGNAPWRFDARPRGHYAETYWERMRILAIAPPHGLSWPEMALRWSAFHSGADCCIVGSTQPDHLRANAHALDAGPLPEELVAELERAWHDGAGHWPGQT